MEYMKILDYVEYMIFFCILVLSEINWIGLIYDFEKDYLDYIF